MVLGKCSPHRGAVCLPVYKFARVQRGTALIIIILLITTTTMIMIIS